MRVLTSEHHAFELRADAAPAVRVRSGETVRIETTPEPAQRLFAAGERWFETLDTRRINAVTGPIWIEGVEPGDAVRVEIRQIDLLDWGWCAVVPGFGLLGDNVQAPHLRRVPLRDGRAWLSEALAVPLRPMIGCFGLAPERGASSTLAPPYPWGGNYDLPQVRAGATLWLPAQVRGGLFSLGDLHAAMGDGEPSSIAIECAGSVTVHLAVDKGLDIQMPRIVVDGRLYTVGLAERGNYPAARRHALDQLFNYLTEERLLTPEDAYVLIVADGGLHFGGPAGAVVLASIPLAPLDERERGRPR